MTISLDARLAAAASLVRQGARCADIGTDHGHLIGALAADASISCGCACDINEKPLQQAAFFLKQLNPPVPVEILLSDGLTALKAGDWDDIIIAGMGGDLIWRIISGVPWTRDPNLRFILCPMTKPERLRRALYENGYRLLQEVPVISGTFPYSVMHAAYTGECVTPDALFCYGGLLLQNPSPEASAYLEKAASLIHEKIEGLARAKNPENGVINELRTLWNGLKHTR